MSRVTLGLDKTLNDYIAGCGDSPEAGLMVPDLPARVGVKGRCSVKVMGEELLDIHCTPENQPITKATFQELGIHAPGGSLYRIENVDAAVQDLIQQ